MKKNYKLSKYNYFFSVDNVDYVYNTFSGALSELSDINGKERLINFEQAPTEEIDDFYKAAIANGFIIKSEVDETQILNFYRSNVICQNEQSVYEILPTTACNARCFYCFEEGVKIKTMTLETAKKVCDFIINNNHNKKRILIQWFGGEPLLMPNIITYITQTLDENLAKKGVEIVYQMTTNGSLITEDMIELFKNVWHISKVQITLDGTKKEYEARKKYVNFPNAFEKVIENINLLADNGITVAIRLNYDRNNINDILDLIDYLGTSITSKNKVICYAYPLFGTDASSAPDVRETALLLVDINKKIVENNLSHGKNTFTLHFVTSKCYACLRNSFLINPEGNLAKCSMAMNEDEFIGNVSTPISLTSKYLNWCSTELPNSECYSCKFLPLCQGGCKAGHLGYSPVKHYIYKNCFTEILTEIVKSSQKNSTP